MILTILDESVRDREKIPQDYDHPRSHASHSSTRKPHVNFNRLSNRLADSSRAMRPSTRAWIVVTVILSVMVLLMTFVQGREYYLGLTDVENDYYYNARVILDSGTPTRITHPGTPVYYVGAVVLAIVGEGQDRTQAFFNAMYLIGLVALAGALLFFVRYVLKNSGLTFTLIVLSTIAVWPPTLTYLNYFSADMLMLPATLVVLAYFWKLLGAPEISYRQIAILGIFVGVTLAIKTNFLQMAVPIGGALAIHFFRMSSGSNLLTQLREVAFKLGIWSGFILLAGAVAISPVLLRSYWLIGKIRDSVRGDGSPNPTFSQQISNFSQGSPQFFQILVIVAVLAIAISLLWLRSNYQRLSFKRHTLAPGESDRLPVITFLGMAGFIFLFSILTQLETPNVLSGEYEGDFGIATRQLTPIAMMLPFVLISFRDLWHRQPNLPALITNHLRSFERAFLVIALLGIVWTFTDYSRSRAETLENLKTDIDVRAEAIDDLFKDGRVAIYDSGLLFGEPAFHLWGNYRYAYDRFDEEVLAKYPQYTQLHLREAALLIEAQQAGTSSTSLAELNRIQNPRIYSGNPAKKLFQQWEDRYIGPDRSTEIITGEGKLDVAAVIHVELRPDQPSTLINPLQTLLPVRLGFLDIACVQQQSSDCLDSIEQAQNLAVGDEVWLVYSFGRWALSN
jgi:hypothetical protein